MNIDSDKASARPEQTINLIPTGIPNLDENLGGGLLRGSLILLVGAPGSGKTLFASRFLYEGAEKYGEPGVYASISESRDTFLEIMKRFGYDFTRLEREGKHSFLNFVTVKEEGVSTLLNQIIEEIQKTQAKRLVIDSYTALATAFTDRITSRTVLQNVLSRITRTMNCTTLLLKEKEVRTRSYEPNLEEFVVDAVFTLEQTEFDHRPLRVLEIRKTRGSKASLQKMLFTLENGFEVHSPLKTPSISPDALEWKTMPDSEDRFSSGNLDLDNLLGGGYPRGSYVLINIGENVPDSIRNVFTEPPMLNFISQSRGVTVVPRPSSSARGVKATVAKYIDGEKIRSLLRVWEKTSYITEDAITIPFEGNIEKDYPSYVAGWKDLKERTDSRPILRIMAEDTSEYTYGLHGILEPITQSISRTAIHGDLTLAIATPQLECTRHLTQLAPIHLRVRELYGYILVYGVKPRTNIHIAEIDCTRGAPELRLHPIR